MSKIMSLLLLVEPLWKNCTVTQNSWLKRKVGLFVLLVLSFDLCSLSPVVCLRSLTIYNVHISFVLLISNSVYTIQLSRASRDTSQQPIRVWEKLPCDQSECWKGSPISRVHQQGPSLWKTDNNPKLQFNIFLLLFKIVEIHIKNWLNLLFMI